LQATRVTDFIAAHLGDDVSLDILAHQVGFSPYHFARMLRQTMGESPHQYVLRRRLERAQRLLHEPVPLARVARAAGFVDQSHFTRTFKQRPWHQISPSSPTTGVAGVRVETLRHTRSSARSTISTP